MTVPVTRAVVAGHWEGTREVQWAQNPMSKANFVNVNAFFTSVRQKKLVISGSNSWASSEQSK